MIKLYYDDGLAARWMEKHFAVNFDGPDLDLPYDPGYDGPEKIRYYVKSDCIKIFFPRIGDLVRGKSGFIGHVISQPDHKRHIKVRSYSQGVFSGTGSYWKQIERDGKFFFAPEREQL
jgi:hypothetical protein